MQAQPAKVLMPLCEERRGRLLEKLTETEGKGEKSKFRRGIKYCHRNKHKSSGKAVLESTQTTGILNKTKESQPNGERTNEGEMHLPQELHCVCASLLLRQQNTLGQQI